MTEKQRPDPIHQLAPRLYGIHRTAIQLADRSPAHLESDFNQILQKILVNGGTVDSHKDPLGVTFPVVKDQSGNVVPYDSGRIESERLLDAIRAAQTRQS